MRIEGNDPSNPFALPSSEGNTTAKDEFLRLFVAQLRHQDPLEPQKGAEFVAQLAQFAALQQSVETNQRLGALQAGQGSSASASYAGLVGRTATARVEQITLDAPGAAPSLVAHLDAAATKVEVAVVDSAGRRVRTLDLGARAPGDVELAWDGRDDAGAPLPAGSYRLEIKSTGSDGKPIGSFVALRGIIRALELQGGAPRFRIGPASVSPADIVTIQA